MDKKADEKTIRTKYDGKDFEETLKKAGPQILSEILYDYLSQNISTHFERTIEGIDQIHSSLHARQKEHFEILQRLDELEERLKKIESKLDDHKVSYLM